METINNLIQQTKEEIEKLIVENKTSYKWLQRKGLIMDGNIDCLFLTDGFEDELKGLIENKLQTAKDIFIKMLDELKIHLKDNIQKDGWGCDVLHYKSTIKNLQELQLKLLGDKG